MDTPKFLKEGEYSKEDLEDFKHQSIWRTVDLYEQQLLELFDVLYPDLKLDPEHDVKRSGFIKERLGLNPELQGNWVYFPWSGTLVHALVESEYNLLRTNRNRNLIQEDEQVKLSDFPVGIVGLSIGNGIAYTLAQIGFTNICVTDYDTLETSNLNRIRARLADVGTKKIEVVSRQMYELNPYIQLKAFSDGIKEANINEFLSTNLKLVFEIIDDFAIKIRIRQVAREKRIPVIMPTNLGDSILIDVERYDLDPNLALFNGLIGSTPEDILSGPITEEDKQKYAIAIVGKENVPKRAIESVKEINKTLVGRPQLITTVTIGAGIAGFLARKIALGEEVKSGRYKVPFENFIKNQL